MNFIAKYPILSAFIFVAIIVAIIVIITKNSGTSRVRVGSPCTSPYGGGQGTINSDGVCIPNDASQRNTWAYAMCRQACFNRNYKNPSDLQSCLGSCDTFKNKTIIIPSNPVTGTSTGIGPVPIPRPGTTGYGNVPFMRR